VVALWSYCGGASVVVLWWCFCGRPVVITMVIVAMGIRRWRSDDTEVTVGRTMGRTGRHRGATVVTVVILWSLCDCATVSVAVSLCHWHVRLSLLALPQLASSIC
jgi:hypothetical protein